MACLSVGRHAWHFALDVTSEFFIIAGAPRLKAGGEWQQKMEKHQAEEAAVDAGESLQRRDALRCRRQSSLERARTVLYSKIAISREKIRLRLLGKASLRSAQNRPPWPSLTCCVAVAARAAVAAPVRHGESTVVTTHRLRLDGAGLTLGRPKIISKLSREARLWDSTVP